MGCQYPITCTIFGLRLNSEQLITQWNVTFTSDTAEFGLPLIPSIFLFYTQTIPNKQKFPMNLTKHYIYREVKIKKTNNKAHGPFKYNN